MIYKNTNIKYKKYITIAIVLLYCNIKKNNNSSIYTINKNTNDINYNFNKIILLIEFKNNNNYSKYFYIIWFIKI